jgi:hypothetical protein
MNKTLLYVIIAVVAIGAVVLVVTRYSGGPAPAPAPSANDPAIVKAVMSRSIDAKGNVNGIADAFSAKTDKLVYAVLTLKNVTKNTKLSYARYLNGKYVDSKVAMPTKDGIITFYFVFEKGLGDYPGGTYTLKLYVNGRYSQSLTYVFK